MNCIPAGAAVIALTLPNLVLSQDDPGSISGERPGFSSSPIALAPGLFQVEGGYQYTRDDHALTVEDHTLPFLLVRAPLGERLEFQFSWAGVSRTSVESVTDTGANDASAGVKWQLTDSSAPLGIGVFGGLSLPVGDDARTSDSFDPTMGLFWSYSPASGPGWFGTALLSEADGTSAGSSVGASFPVSGNAGGYVEYFGIFNEGDGPAHSLNGGVAFTANPDLQFDIHVGLGLNDAAPDFFLGFGIARRWQLNRR